MPRYRTVIVACVAIAALTGGLAMCRNEHVASAFMAFSGGIVGVIGALAAKAGVEHRANSRANSQPHPASRNGSSQPNRPMVHPQDEHSK